MRPLKQGLLSFAQHIFVRNSIYYYRADILKSTLETGEKIKIAGFGNFKIKQKNDRKGRNPQTGETITIAA